MNKFKKKLPSDLVVDDISNIRNFSYKVGEVGLNFSLSIDDSKQAKAFLRCLLKAQEDVQLMIKEDFE